MCRHCVLALNVMYKFFILFFAAFFFKYSYADINKVLGYYVVGYASYHYSREEACENAFNMYAPPQGSIKESFSVIDTGQVFCYIYRRSSGGTLYYVSPQILSTYICPKNSTDVGRQCSCNSGYIEDGGQCVEDLPPDPCELLEPACRGSQNHSVNFQLSGKKTGVSFVCMNPTVIGSDGSFPGCTRGCLGIVGGFTSAFQSDDGQWVTQGSARFTGSTCDPSVINDLNSDSDPEYVPEENPETTNPPDPSCPNGFKGTVNGVSVCLPPKSSEGLLEKEEIDNGDGTKTEKQTKVKCENGLCQITTTTNTKDTSSNTVVSSSVTTTVEKGRFCAENPTAAACKNEYGEEDGGSSFSGSCGAGFTCDGDAVMCAIAKEQHTRACQIFDDETAEGQLYAAEKGKEGAQRGEGIDMGAVDLGGGVGSLIQTDSLIGSGSCVQDLQFTFMDQPVNIPLSSLCPYLAMLGNILVAVGMVMAIRIVGVR